MKRRKDIFFFGAVLVIMAAFLAFIVLPAIEASVNDYIESRVESGIRRSAQDMHVQALLQAARESEEFVASRMGMARSYPNRYVLFDASLSRVDPKLNGMYCEFGVYRGASINYIASRVSAVVHGFDSFVGNPEDWRPGFEKGMFPAQGLPRVRPNVRLHKGWFKDSLPVFKKDHPEPLAFGHLDADLYSSTKDVFDALGDHIVAGTVLQFDEFLNYPGWQEGESKAFLEFCQARSAEVEYLGYVANDQQVAVRIKKIAPPSP
jgi:hypothetical protein